VFSLMVFWSVAESSLSSFEQTDEPVDGKKSLTQMPVKLFLGSPGRGGHIVPNSKDFG